MLKYLSMLVLALLPSMANSQARYPNPGSTIEIFTEKHFQSGDGGVCVAQRGGTLTIERALNEYVTASYTPPKANAPACKNLQISWQHIRQLKVAEDEYNLYRRVTGEKL